MRQYEYEYSGGRKMRENFLRAFARLDDAVKSLADDNCWQKSKRNKRTIETREQGRTAFVAN